MQKITPFLWYSKEAEEAAAFYASIFPDSRVTRVTSLLSESPSGPPGSVKVVEFVLFGQPFVAMSAGPLDPFNHAVSFVVNCDDQAEVDRYWNALLQGGSAEQCGWLKDRYGLSWQIVPTVLGKMMADPDRAKAKRASDAMMKMVKIDIAALEAAASGKTEAAGGPRVEGEGSYTGARQYDEATRQFVKKGKVEQAARAAAPNSSAEAAEMDEAEQEGLRHAKGEHPAAKTGSTSPRRGK